jgi:NAD(P)H-nitrite reductase large subunit
MRYAIIGNGIASLGAVEGIRSRDPQGDIALFSREQDMTYGRPLISYFLAGKLPEERMLLRPEIFYQKKGVKTRLGVSVQTLDRDKRVFELSDGSREEYDRLLLATGGNPIFPPIEGSDGPDVYPFISLEDAWELDTAVKGMRRAVVIGGGLIGLKAAEALFDRGVDVTIVELAPRILSAAFDDEAGRLVTSRLEDMGFNIRCQDTVEKIERSGNNRVRGVFLKSGDFLEADAVVMAIGVTPRIDLARDCGLETNRGIVVDNFMQTSLPGVYAAGDVAEARDILLGDKRVTPIWPNAYSQGITAGRNMAGEQAEHPGGLAMNSIGFYGLPTVSIGIVNPSGNEGFEVERELDTDKQKYHKLVFRNDRLVGCVLVGDISQAGNYNAYIRFQLPLDKKTKSQLLSGQPTPLQWPEEKFRMEWNPRSRLI